MRAGELFKVIAVLEAQELLNQITISSYPHLKSAEQRKVRDRINKIAYPIKEKKQMTPKEAAKFLRAKFG